MSAVEAVQAAFDTRTEQTPEAFLYALNAAGYKVVRLNESDLVAFHAWVVENRSAEAPALESSLHAFAASTGQLIWGP